MELLIVHGAVCTVTYTILDNAPTIYVFHCVD